MQDGDGNMPKQPASVIRWGTVAGVSGSSLGTIGTYTRYERRAADADLERRGDAAWGRYGVGEVSLACCSNRRRVATAGGALALRYCWFQLVYVRSLLSSHCLVDVGSIFLLRRWRPTILIKCLV